MAEQLAEPPPPHKNVGDGGVVLVEKTTIIGPVTPPPEAPASSLPRKRKKTPADPPADCSAGSGVDATALAPARPLGREGKMSRAERKKIARDTQKELITKLDLVRRS